MALMVFVMAACRDGSALTIALAVALLVALMTTTTRSPAVCARLIMSTRFWLFQPAHGRVVDHHRPDAVGGGAPQLRLPLQFP